ncbi:MAG: NAD(P)-binding domain-containing protein [Fibrobacter sp.]|nr:NAD(P)-binding domain-containing protein [Fibrobacter sp.]
MSSFNKIGIIGAGAFGTALATVLTRNDSNCVILFSIEADVVEQINTKHINEKYFPNIILPMRIVATTEVQNIIDCDYLLIALPSSVVVPFVKSISSQIPDKTILINLAKGFGNNGIITSELEKITKNTICSIKGPTFAIELIRGLPAGITLATNENRNVDKIRELFSGSHLSLDYSDDMTGVEMLSILKNIYAILIGLVDAYYDSTNVRFMVLTKAFEEIKYLCNLWGGEEETLFKYCGIGDFCLTSLNDLSRNRTLGLLVGKGFLGSVCYDGVILEGKRSLKLIYQNSCTHDPNALQYLPLLTELYRIFYSGSMPVKSIKNIVNVITI